VVFVGEKGLWQKIGNAALENLHIFAVVFNPIQRAKSKTNNI